MAASIWKGSISFGLLNIPVSLQGAEEDKSIHFSMLDKKDLSKIKYQKISAKTGKEVPFDRIVKGYQYNPGHFVVMNEADFKKANVKATQTLDIEDFVLLDEVDPMLFDRPYYLVPQKGGEKGYYLLRDALAKTQKVAIGKIVIRIKQHLGMVMAKGDYLILELLRFSHQIKTEKQVSFLKDSPKVAYTAKELKMAEGLIAGMTSDWKPEQYKDTYYHDMMKLIQERVKKGQGHILKESENIKITPTDNVVDLMPLLMKSLEARGKTKTAKKKTVRRAGA